MGEYKYHREEPKIISEESDEKVKEEDDMTIKDDIYEEDVIVDKPSNNEDYEEIPSATGDVIIKKSPSVRNNTYPQISSESMDIQEYQPSSKEKYKEMKFLLISKQKKCEWADDYYRTAMNIMYTQMIA